MLSSERTTPRSSPTCLGLLVCGVGLLLALALGTHTELAPRDPSWTQPLEVTILHTNDIHGQVLNPDWTEAGLVRLGRTIRQEHTLRSNVKRRPPRPPQT